MIFRAKGLGTLENLGSWWVSFVRWYDFGLSTMCHKIVPLSCNTRRYRQLSILNDIGTLSRLSITTFPFGPKKRAGLQKKRAFVAGSPDHSPACARDTIESWDLDVLDLDTEGQAKVHQVRRAWEKGPKRWWGCGVCHLTSRATLFFHHSPLVPYKNWLI